LVGEVAYIKDKNGIDLVLNADGTIGIGTVAVSGSTVRLISGDTIQVVVKDTGGAALALKNTTSDANTSTSTQGAVGVSLLHGFHTTNATWARIAAVSPVSGAGYRVLAAISGETVTIAGGVNVSGATIRIANDGINNVVKVSGETVRLVNDGVNNIAQISGQVVYTYGTTPKTNALVVITNLSGGTTLPNISCVRCYIRSVSGNDVMYIGGTGAQAPFSGTGMELYGGEMTPPLDVNNTNTIAIFAATSGQRVSIFAIA